MITHHKKGFRYMVGLAIRANELDSNFLSKKPYCVIYRQNRLYEIYIGCSVCGGAKYFKRDSREEMSLLMGYLNDETLCDLCKEKQRFTMGERTP
jgi:hypothetical protein